MKYIRLLVIFFIVSLLLPSCNSIIDDSRYTGVLADDEIVASIKQEMEDKENSDMAKDGEVFWTKSGKLWHGSIDCSYLANSKTVLHGTIEEAKLAGKEKACDRCSTGVTDSFYESLENNEIKPGDVFFVKDGNVWHTNINCSEILGAQKIYYADKETAKMLGKSSACTKCED